MLKKLIAAVRVKGKTRLKDKFDYEARELALELALAFLLAVVTEGIDKDELADLESRFNALKQALKD